VKADVRRIRDETVTSGIGYRIVERFDPTWPSWPGYVSWSKLTHLTEVVGLDSSLWPAVVRVESEDDWKHALYNEYIFAVFDDWKYAKSRLTDTHEMERLQVLAVLREPAEDPGQELAPEDFEFIGYDLIEEATEISALNNCVHFDEAFCPEDLNQRGLISDFAKAYNVRRRLA